MDTSVTSGRSIIWLASFPRSGNTLLRQILYLTMGQATDLYSSTSQVSEMESDLIALGRAQQPIPEVRKLRASVSGPDASNPETSSIFIKTHALPVDKQPALNVVRDGRATLASFLEYERHFSPDSPSNSLLRLILGDHYFGGWSDHYRAWHNRGDDAPILTLQYADLLQADEKILHEIAAFIGYDGPIAPWNNPIDELRPFYPTLIGDGKLDWHPTSEWDFVCDSVFWHIHGELMQELDLDDAQRIAAPGEGADEAVAQFVPLLKSWIDEQRCLQRAFDEKEDVVRALAHDSADRKSALQELTQEIKKVKRERDLQEVAEREGNEAAQRIQIALGDVERRQVEQLQRIVGRETQRYAEAASQQFDTQIKTAREEAARRLSRELDLAVERFAREAEGVLTERLNHVSDAAAARVEERLARLRTALERQRDDAIQSLEDRGHQVESSLRERLHEIATDAEAERAVLDARLHELARRLDELATRA